MPQRLQEQLRAAKHPPVEVKKVGVKKEPVAKGAATAYPMLRPKAPYAPPQAPRQVPAKAPPAGGVSAVDAGPVDVEAETPVLVPAAIPTVANDGDGARAEEPETPFMDPEAEDDTAVTPAQEETPCQRAHRFPMGY